MNGQWLQPPLGTSAICGGRNARTSRAANSSLHGAMRTMNGLGSCVAMRLRSCFEAQFRKSRHTMYWGFTCSLRDGFILIRSVTLIDHHVIVSIGQSYLPHTLSSAGARANSLGHRLATSLTP